MHREHEQVLRQRKMKHGRAEQRTSLQIERGQREPPAAAAARAAEFGRRGGKADVLDGERVRIPDELLDSPPIAGNKHGAQRLMTVDQRMQARVQHFGIERLESFGSCRGDTRCSSGQPPYGNQRRC